MLHKIEVFPTCPYDHRHYHRGTSRETFHIVSHSALSFIAFPRSSNISSCQHLSPILPGRIKHISIFWAQESPLVNFTNRLLFCSIEMTSKLLFFSGSKERCSKVAIEMHFYLDMCILTLLERWRYRQSRNESARQRHKVISHLIRVSSSNHTINEFLKYFKAWVKEFYKDFFLFISPETTVLMKQNLARGKFLSSYTFLPSVDGFSWVTFQDCFLNVSHFQEIADR